MSRTVQFSQPGAPPPGGQQQPGQARPSAPQAGQPGQPGQPGQLGQPGQPGPPQGPYGQAPYGQPPHGQPPHPQQPPFPQQGAYGPPPHGQQPFPQQPPFPQPPQQHPGLAPQAGHGAPYGTPPGHGQYAPAPQGQYAPPPPPPGLPPAGLQPQMPHAPAGTVAVSTGPRHEHPLLSPMYWACADLLAFAPQLAHGENLPAPDALRNTCRGMFNEMGRRAQESNIPPEDVRDAQYAIAALLDEQILRGQWGGRGEWNANLLQFIYFQENTAGEGFFRRLDALRSEPHRAHVLQIYFLCLAMGFQGRYQMAGGEGLANVIEQTAAVLDRSVPASDIISPHGEPPDLNKNVFTSDMPLIRIGIGVVALALILFIGLKIIIGVSASSTTKQMKSYATSPK